MRNRVTLSLPNIPGSLRLLMPINILSSAQTQFATSFWPIMAELTLIWTTYVYSEIMIPHTHGLTRTRAAIVAWIPCWLTQHGYAVPYQLGSLMMQWALCPSTPSSCA
jgi:hypothetical protein